ncbi:MAG: glycosyltransferase family 2 protein [Candidatus Eremiobacterota bacterium]
MRLLSIVVPVYNEEDNVHRLYEALLPVMRGLQERYRFELIFTDNHSTDRTFPILRSLAESDPRVRVFRFSRNFGFQKSIFTGYLKARGDAVIQVDCDLQDPPSLIPEFVEKWEQGFQVVYGVRRKRQEGWLVTTLRKTFYRLLNFLSEDTLPPDAGDFRLIDRRIVEELRLIDDQQPYLRGAIATLGFNQVGIPYDRAAREHGESKFGVGDLVRLAVDGIANHSTLPLRLASMVGFVTTILTMLAAVFYIVGRFRGGDWPAGFATVTVLILFSTSLNAIFFGVIGEYLSRIYQQVKRRPLTVIEYAIDAQERTEGQDELRAR